MSYFTPHGYDHGDFTTWPPMPEPLRSEFITLSIKQQPRQALVAAPKKEKARKPIDPPVVVQMQVQRQADATQMFLHNPFLFVVATLAYENGQSVAGQGSQRLIGRTTSSLHRLKDIDELGNWGDDGGFFVFGDLSVTVTGRYRLCFSLFELDKDEGVVTPLQSIQSGVFDVVTSRDYLGLDESTNLTKAFADQGVRLRLRKEVRTVGMQQSRRGTRSTLDTDDRNILPKVDDSPSENKLKRPGSDSPRPAKRMKSEFGPMFPGVKNNTRGWGAFRREDMETWCGAEERTSFAIASPMALDQRSSNPFAYSASNMFTGRPYTPPHLPSITQPMAAMPTPAPTDWQRNEAAPQRPLQPGFNTNVLSSPNMAMQSGSIVHPSLSGQPHHEQNQYQPSSVFESPPTFTRQQPVRTPQRSFVQPQGIPPSPPYTSHQNRQFHFGASPARHPYGESSRMQTGYFDNVSRAPDPLVADQRPQGTEEALQALASASEQRPYLAQSGIGGNDIPGALGEPVTLGASQQSGATTFDGQHPMASAQHVQNSLPQVRNTYQIPGMAGMGFEAAPGHQLQQNFRSAAAPTSLNWAGMPEISGLPSLQSTEKAMSEELILNC
ncbi:hypothetical protein NA57DRAFT_70431 [Rhizodiscina lignyota]|uniref:Velvet domain-containing protein n=1 Tax=Rhizodiscina lignyota TaxID=1504668 RepID=A0A9P4MG63_9PEZI|nr:hypothetical protein NA57DRAFT_70431 [Rhizodiscina lignyota]